MLSQKALHFFSVRVGNQAVQATLLGPLFQGFQRDKSCQRERALASGHERWTRVTRHKIGRKTNAASLARVAVRSSTSRGRASYGPCRLWVEAVSAKIEGGEALALLRRDAGGFLFIPSAQVMEGLAEAAVAREKCGFFTAVARFKARLAEAPSTADALSDVCCLAAECMEYVMETEEMKAWMEDKGKQLRETVAGDKARLQQQAPCRCPEGARDLCREVRCLGWRCGKRLMEAECPREDLL